MHQSLSSSCRGTTPVLDTIGQPATDRSRQAKATTTAAAVVASPWRAHRGIEAEKARLQSLLEEAEEERRHCGGVVQAALLKSITKSEAAITALDVNSGGTALDRLSDDAKLRELQQ